MPGFVFAAQYNVIRNSYNMSFMSGEGSVIGKKIPVKLE